MYEQIETSITEIKTYRPLILNITNHVTMNFVANGLLSLGASPIMSLAMEEMHDLLKIAQAVVINIGTLDDRFIRLCEHVCYTANQLGKPIIFDPVGAGATQYRTQTCLNLLEQFNFSVIRGNASEIMALAGSSQNTKGVDSSVATQYAIESAQFLTQHHRAVIAISGPTDTVVDANHTQDFHRGSPLMPMITGSGCLLTAVVGAFRAVHQHSYEATAAAIEFYSVCGELAAQRATGPGTFLSHFLDELSFLPARSDYSL
jgi:hydroxyethylthiazole kinase